MVDASEKETAPLAAGPPANKAAGSVAVWVVRNKIDLVQHAQRNELGSQSDGSNESRSQVNKSLMDMVNVISYQVLVNLHSTQANRHSVFPLNPAKALMH